MCIFGSGTFVPVSWMCKKQTSVSHSSTESEIIPLDAGLRMDGLFALGLWDMVIEVLQSTKDKTQPTQISHQETGCSFILNQDSTCHEKTEGEPNERSGSRTHHTFALTELGPDRVRPASPNNPNHWSVCVLVCVLLCVGVCCCVWCVWCVVVCVLVCVVCGPDLRGVKIQIVWGGVVWVVRSALSRYRPLALRRTALWRDRPHRWTAQHFALFFFTLPHPFSFFSLSAVV